MTALAGAIVLVALTLLAETLSRSPVKSISAHRPRASGSLKRADETPKSWWRWECRSGCLCAGSVSAAAYRQQKRASDVAGGLGAAGRVLRTGLQSAVLGVGAYLVIQQEATAGIIIASSILTGRALAPIDLAIANWKGFVSARQGWRRLDQLLAALPALAPRLELPPPAQVRLSRVWLSPARRQNLVVHDINFALKAGSAAGIVGPSASGKSSLVRAIVGVWPRPAAACGSTEQPSTSGRRLRGPPHRIPAAGRRAVRGNDCAEHRPVRPDAPAGGVIAAAKAAGVHDLIVNLPAGYETELGERGTALSAGQQQRIALARALYGEPFLVVLDEPNSNLDAEGEEALTKAILGVRARGGIVIIVAHRPSALAAVDHVLAWCGERSRPSGRRTKSPRQAIRREFRPGAAQGRSRTNG